jgi:hypothetical protein
MYYEFRFMQIEMEQILNARGSKTAGVAILLRPCAYFKGFSGRSLITLM